MSRKPKGYYSSWTVERFKEEVEKLGADSRNDLRKKDSGLYQYARKKVGWLGAVFGSRGYSALSLDNFIRIVEELGYNSRGELQKKNSVLYQHARNQTGWLDAVFGDSLRRDFSDWTVEDFKNEVNRIGAKTRKELYVKDGGLYNYALKQDDWMYAVFGGPLRRDLSGWTVERFREEVEKIGVESRNDLRINDPGLYKYALNNGWLGAVFGSRGYSALSLDNFVRIVEELDYTSRSDLSKKDSGLYDYARKQNGWFDAVFGDPLNQNYSGWTQDLFRKEIKKIGATSRRDLQRKAQGLYQYASKQDGWLDAAFGDPLNRDYSGWGVERFKKEVEKIGAESRKDLRKKDGGLYAYALKQDGWLFAAFGKGRIIRKLSDWTVERFKKEVEKISASSRIDLYRKDQSLHQYARRKGWLDAVFPKSSGSIDSILDSYANDASDGE